MPDKYNFDWHYEKNALWRNIGTEIGLAVSEAFCIEMDAVTFNEWNVFMGYNLGRIFNIVNGLVRRHIIGDTEFYIIFSDSIIIE